MIVKRFGGRPRSGRLAWSAVECGSDRLELCDPRSSLRELDLLTATNPRTLTEVYFLLRDPAVDSRLRDPEIAGDLTPGTYIESFNSRMRDEHWNVEEFTTLTEAQILTEQWRIEYNTIRPHSALAGHPHDEYAERWQKGQQLTPTLSDQLDHQTGGPDDLTTQRRSGQCGRSPGRTSSAAGDAPPNRCNPSTAPAIPRVRASDTPPSPCSRSCPATTACGGELRQAGALLPGALVVGGHHAGGPCRGFAR